LSPGVLSGVVEELDGEVFGAHFAVFPAEVVFFVAEDFDVVLAGEGGLAGGADVHDEGADSAADAGEGDVDLVRAFVDDVGGFDAFDGVYHGVQYVNDGGAGGAEVFRNVCPSRHDGLGVQVHDEVEVGSEDAFINEGDGDGFGRVVAVRPFENACRGGVVLAGLGHAVAGGVVDRCRAFRAAFAGDGEEGFVFVGVYLVGEAVELEGLLGRVGSEAEGDVEGEVGDGELLLAGL